MIIWPIVGAAAHLHEPLVNGLSNVDYTILALAALAICGLISKSARDAFEIARDEGHAPFAAPVADSEDLELQSEETAVSADR